MGNKTYAVGEGALPRESAFPLVVNGCGQVTLEAAVSEIRISIQRQLEHFGAIRFTNFTEASPVTFERFVRVVSTDPPLEYVYRSTPRDKVGSGIYTASEYPAHLTIPMHNENAFQRDWPMRVLFFCVRPAQTGGNTPLAYTPAVTRRIPKTVRDRFDDKKVMYVRNYNVGVDLPWQIVFQTQNPSEVEQYCRSHDIQIEWKPDGGLRTTQVCQALATHPHTGTRVWFNQAHLFHVSSLDADSREAMLEVFQEEDLPRNAYFGDGSPIPESDLEAVRESFRCETATFPWQAGDVLMLDNMLVSHGRQPYQGERKILAALCDPYSSAAPC